MQQEISLPVAHAVVVVMPAPLLWGDCISGLHSGDIIIFICTVIHEKSAGSTNLTDWLDLKPRLARRKFSKRMVNENNRMEKLTMATIINMFSSVQTSIVKTLTELNSGSSQIVSFQIQVLLLLVVKINLKLRKCLESWDRKAFADITSLATVSLETNVTEDMRIDYVKKNILKFKPVIIDIPEDADSSSCIIIASLELTASSSIKHLIIKYS